MKSQSRCRCVSAALLSAFMTFLSSATHAQVAAAGAEAQRPPAPQMTTAGAFRVNETGAAAYEIPIRVPPGTVRIEPKLALAYNSQSANGLAGVGWSLSGLSAITRCPRTIAQDGVRGAVRFDSNDRFCLDGQRLIAISGTYGADGTEYRTERDSFTRIFSWGTAGSGPSWLEVWTKAGHVMQFGNTANSKIEAQGKSTVRVWALNHIVDTDGNYLTVSYTEDGVNGDYRPSRIDYTGNDWVPTTPGQSVQFVYETRTDSTPLYQAGSLIKTTVRLTNVKTYVGTSLVTDYRLVYDNQGTVSRSRLTSVTECNAASQCLPATTAGWQNGGSPTLGSSVSTAWLTGGSPSDRWFLSADVSGDGRSDAILYDPTSGHARVSLANGGGSFGAHVSTLLGTGGSPADRWFTTADVNANGRADAVLYNPGSGNVTVWLSTGTGAFGSGVNTAIGTGGSPTDRWFMMADVNGDGRADAVLYNPGSGNVTVWLSSGTGGFGSGVNTAIGTGGSPTDRWFRMADVDGDARADAVLYNPASGTVTAWLSNGNGSFATGVSTSFASGGSPSDRWFFAADINGDAKADAFLYDPTSGFIRAALSFGDGRFTPVTSTLWGTGGSPSDRWVLLADVNGDGRADAVRYEPSNGNFTASLSSGNGSFQAAVVTLFTSGGSPSDRWFTTVDVGGDGKEDVVLYDPTGGALVSAPASGPYPDLATSINNGIGGNTGITYKPLTDSAVYTKDTSASYPTVNVQFALYVASTVTRSNAIGGNFTNNHTYGGARVDLNGRGFLGFRWTQATEPVTGVSGRTEYRQDWPYTGLPSQIKRTKSGGGVLTQVDNTYACKDFDVDPDTCTIAVGKRYFSYVKQSDEVNYELDTGAFVTKLRTTHTFDSFGNPTQIVVTHLNADNTSTGYSKTTNNTYTNNTANWNWLLGRLTRSTVQSVTP